MKSNADKQPRDLRFERFKARLSRLTDRWIPPYILFLFCLFVFTIVLYVLFRLATLLYNRPQLSFFKSPDPEILSAFVIGLRFDILITCVGLITPFLALSISYFFRFREEQVYRFVRAYFVVVVLSSFMICAADLPYFQFFNSRFNRTALTLRNLPHSLGHIVREPAYYPMIIISLLAITGVNRMIRWLWSATHEDRHTHKRAKAIWALVLFGLLLVGIFGVRRPQRPSMQRAFFSTDGFYNQLALNPVHTFFDSYLKWDLPYLPIPIAIRQVRESLHTGGSSTEYVSPIAHRRYGRKNGKKMNVVLILMESMSAAYMGAYGKVKGCTPGLDSLIQESIFFDRHYSNGIHTNAGLFSSIYGMPVYMLDHPMLDPKAQAAEFTGLPVTLKKLGYSTSFFCTHEKSFDNVGPFLSKNGFDHIHDLSSYDPKFRVNTWGVPDEILTEHTFLTLDSLAKHDDKPFFATMLTITSHPPYALPPFTEFKPNSTDPRDQVYEYADWAISNFMRRCAQTDWYENTIFVLVGDHGLKMNDQDEVPLSYNHVPLIIKAPSLYKKGKVMHGMANQTDIFPTVMGMLGLDYIQNTLGYDLMQQQRPYAFFSQDEKLGVINDDFLFVSRKSGYESISLYQENQGLDLSAQYQITKDEMRSYATQMLQISEWLILKNLTGSMEGKEKI